MLQRCRFHTNLEAIPAPYVAKILSPPLFYILQQKDSSLQRVVFQQEIPFGKKNVPIDAGNNQTCIAYNDEPTTVQEQQTVNAALQAEMLGQQDENDNLQAQQPANNDN